MPAALVTSKDTHEHQGDNIGDTGKKGEPKHDRIIVTMYHDSRAINVKYSSVILFTDYGTVIKMCILFFLHVHCNNTETIYIDHSLT